MLSEPLLGYKSTWRILNLLFETPRKPVSRNELFKFTGLGNSPLSRGLERLTRANILILEKKGKKEFYHVNETNEYAKILRELWSAETKSLRNLPYEIRIILAELIRSLNDSCKGIIKIILFGSHAKGIASIHSDIDLALVFKNDLAQEILATRAVKKVDEQFKTKIQIHYFTSKSFAAKNKLTEAIKNEGINLAD